MKYILVLLVSLALMPTSWANWSKDKQSMHIDSATIEFSEGSYALTESQKSSIRDLVKKAKSTENRDWNLGVAAWADVPFPQGESEASSAQRDLADNRLKAINNFIETMDAPVDVDTYNMAEKSNWLAKLFNTEASEIKSTFAKKDMKTSTMKEKYQVYKKEGAPNKAVLVLHKDM